MRIVREQLTGRRGWLTTGALSVALTAALTAQLAPTAAAADTGTVAANSDAAPAVVAPVGTAAAAPAAEIVPVPVPAARQAAPKAAPKAKPRTKSAGDVCSGPGWQQKRGARALASLKHRTPAGVTVAFKAGRPGYLGLTYPQRGHIDMFVRSCSAESAGLLRHVMAHEMGHAYDAKYMSPASRRAYMAARGIPAGTPWFGCSYCTDFATPAGDFAETYAQWQRGASSSRTQMAPAPDAAVLARLAATFFSR